MRRVPEIDGLRGLAAVAILFFHLCPRYLPDGWAAVDLFFVLSGYLITSNILRDGGSPGFLRTFYIRRGLRIWPIYYLLIIGLVMLGTTHSWRTIACFLTYTQQLPLYLYPQRPRPIFAPNWPYMNHAWTLAIEEQFYMLWPAMLLAVGRNRVCRLSAMLLVMSITARCVGFSHLLLISRCDGLALGALLAGLEHQGRPTHGRLAIGVGLAIWTVMACVYAAPRSGEPWGAHDNAMLAVRIFAPALTFYGLVASIAAQARMGGGPLTGWLGSRPLVYLGTISYGIYLYHEPLIHELRWRFRGLPGETAIVGATTMIVTLAVASASWFLIEKRVLRLKDRFGYRAAEPGGPHHAIDRIGLDASQFAPLESFATVKESPALSVSAEP